MFTLRPVVVDLSAVPPAATATAATAASDAAEAQQGSAPLDPALAQLRRLHAILAGE